MVHELRALVAANERFYQAFEAAEPLAMDEVWAQLPGDTCIHPGWDPIRGPINVANSWRRIFAGQERLAVQLSELHAEIHGDVGVVHLVENIWVARTRQEVGKVAATNLFVRRDGAWKLTLHHGSPMGGPPDELSTKPGEPDN